MGRQIVKQPDGKFACWSTNCDDFIAVDLTEEQYIELRAQEAYKEKKKEMKNLFEEIANGRGRMHTKNYNECLEKIEERK